MVRARREPSMVAINSIRGIVRLWNGGDSTLGHHKHGRVAFLILQQQVSHGRRNPIHWRLRTREVG